MSRTGQLVADELGASGRFEIGQKLGSGAFGVVYEAWDRERMMQVALKRLHHLHPTAIYRFKKEFRSLADVTHLNLVQLYELLADGSQWFFTMELVRGVPLLDWVRPGAGLDVREVPSGEVTVESGRLSARETLVYERETVRATVLDEKRLRAAFRQLADGVDALHAAGKLHRDLKSQNVLVARDGRVVLLDFGLVHELSQRSSREAYDGDNVGTPLYMAPEQSTGAPLTESADWYAVGVALYRALTGHFPFDGRSLEVLVAKQTRDPLPPCTMAPDVPDDLDRLCMELLRRQPRDRPSGREVLARLGKIDSPVPAVSSAPGERPFVGRALELARLHEAARGARRGRGKTVFVHGPSGMGKSALVRHFLDTLATEQPGVLILEGRCYSSESLPFKAIDSVVDRLGRFLAALPTEALVPLLPAHIGELALLFPTLRRVREIDTASEQVAQLPDPIERRRRALGALRELLTRIAKRRPLVIFVDDLQWGDVDSALALAQLVQPPEPPPFLLVGTYRSEEAQTSPFLRTLSALAPSLTHSSDDDIAIGALAAEDAQVLVEALLAHGDNPSDPRAQRIAEEAAGSPLFIDQLATAVQEHDEQSVRDNAPRDGALLTLSEVIAQRIASLPADARSLLDVLAVAGQPVADDVLRAATGFGSLEASGLRLLHIARLVRTRTTDGRERLEVYHDRIRETAVARLAPTAFLAAHRGLAVALEQSGHADPEALAMHWRAAGDLARAFEHYVHAAERSSVALAFDRAARLFREARELRPASARRDGALEVQLGDALRDAGRGAEAARVYADAAHVVADPDAALELRRQSAEQLLASGHLDEARRELASVLEAVGMSLPQTSERAIAAFLARRAQLRLRGLDFVERPAGSAQGRERFKMDVCWTIAIGLAMVDPVRAGAFQSVHMLLALKSGDVARVARALAVEVPFSATPGPSNRARTAMLTRRAKQLAAVVADANLDGLLTSSIGGAAWLEGRWLDGLELEERADEILRTRCTGVAWQIDTTSIVLFDCLYRLGRWREVIERVPALIADARMRGDLYMEIYALVKFGALLRLASGEPEEASAELTRAIGRWSQERFSLLHYWESYGQIECALYRGRPADAWRRANDAVSGVKESLLLQLQLYRVSWADIRGRAALALAAQEVGAGREARVRETDSCVRALAGEKVTWAAGLAALLRAGALATRGELAAAATSLLEAERLLEQAAMSLHVAVTRARRGELSGDSALLESAHSSIAAQGVRDPARIVDVLAPGAY